jgi:hypothetical protein
MARSLGAATSGVSFSPFQGLKTVTHAFVRGLFCSHKSEFGKFSQGIDSKSAPWKLHATVSADRSHNRWIWRSRWLILDMAWGELLGYPRQRIATCLITSSIFLERTSRNEGLLVYKITIRYNHRHVNRPSWCVTKSMHYVTKSMRYVLFRCWERPCRCYCSFQGIGSLMRDILHPSSPEPCSSELS